MTTLRGIETLKTASSAHVHSIPGTHRSSYLDLFMLQKEKDTLEKDSQKIERRLKNNLNRLQEIEDQMATLIEQNAAQPPKKRAVPERAAGLPAGEDEDTKWETMKLGY